MTGATNTIVRNGVTWERCMESVRILESSHVMSPLVYLKEQGSTPKMDVYRYISRGPNM